MRAVGVTRFGGPEELRVLDVPAEPLGAGEVRVRVRAAAVNPTDTTLISGAFADGDRPASGVAVPGMDVAGFITEVGPGSPARLRPGARVMAIVAPSGAHGGYRDELVLPAGSVTAVPAGDSDAEASTLPMNGLTARRALDLLRLQPGQALAVTGAAGAFGGYLVQLARHEGLTVIADASPADRQLVKELGADIVVDRGPGVAAQIRSYFPDGVDGLADGSAQGAVAVPAVRDGGVFVNLRFGYQGDGRRGITVSQVLVLEYAKNWGENWAKLDALRELAEQGVLTRRVAGTLPLEQAAEAHRRLAAGGTRGRLVLLPG